MPIDYKDIIEYLKDKLHIPNNKIFNFFGTPGEKKFHQIYNFCQEALLKHINYGISPSLFYFRNNSNINARAIKINNKYLIEINKGLIEFFDKFYVSYFDLSDFD